MTRSAMRGSTMCHVGAVTLLGLTLFAATDKM